MKTGSELISRNRPLLHIAVHYQDDNGKGTSSDHQKDNAHYVRAEEGCFSSCRCGFRRGSSRRCRGREYYLDGLNVAPLTGDTMIVECPDSDVVDSRAKISDVEVC